MEKKNSPVWATTYGNALRMNQAADELSRLRDESASMEEQVRNLLRLDRDQGHEIAKLQSAVFVLMQMIAEKGLVDGNEMNARIHAAFEALEADPGWQRMRGL